MPTVTVTVNGEDIQVDDDAWVGMGKATQGGRGPVIAVYPEGISICDDFPFSKDNPVKSLCRSLTAAQEQGHITNEDMRSRWPSDKEPRYTLGPE